MFISNNLQYVSQTDNQYTVKNTLGKMISVPKIWYQKKQTSNTSRLHFHEKWLKLAFFGLPIGGVLTVMFVPLLIWRNIVLFRTGMLNKHQTIHVKNLIISSLVILLPGIVFFALFLLHLVF